MTTFYLVAKTILMIYSPYLVDLKQRVFIYLLRVLVTIDRIFKLPNISEMSFIDSYFHRNSVQEVLTLWMTPTDDRQAASDTSAL